MPRQGWRIVDGIRWCWYCSRSCVGKMQGRHAAAERRFEQNFAAARVAKQVTARQRKVAEVREDVADLTRYGVPQALAVAILVRVASRSEQRGYNRAYSRMVGTPKRRTAAA